MSPSPVSWTRKGETDLVGSTIGRPYDPAYEHTSQLLQSFYSNAERNPANVFYSKLNSNKKSVHEIIQHYPIAKGFFYDVSEEKENSSVPNKQEDEPRKELKEPGKKVQLGKYWYSPVVNFFHSLSLSSEKNDTKVNQPTPSETTNESTVRSVSSSKRAPYKLPVRLHSSSSLGMVRQSSQGSIQSQHPSFYSDENSYRFNQSIGLEPRNDSFYSVPTNENKFSLDTNRSLSKSDHMFSNPFVKQNSLGNTVPTFGSNNTDGDRQSNPLVQHGNLNMGSQTSRDSSGGSSPEIWNRSLNKSHHLSKRFSGDFSEKNGFGSPRQINGQSTVEDTPIKPQSFHAGFNYNYNVPNYMRTIKNNHNDIYDSPEKNINLIRSQSSQNTGRTYQTDKASKADLNSTYYYNYYPADDYMAALEKKKHLEEMLRKEQNKFAGKDKKPRNDKEIMNSVSGSRSFEKKDSFTYLGKTGHTYNKVNRPILRSEQYREQPKNKMDNSRLESKKSNDSIRSYRNQRTSNKDISGKKTGSRELSNNKNSANNSEDTTGSNDKPSNQKGQSSITDSILSQLQTVCQLSPITTSRRRLMSGRDCIDVSKPVIFSNREPSESFFTPMACR